ncbi:MAG: hypothetical protein QI199_08740 [Candidatus Korarchaeota archaeon]|nr:hypothetical protein [Candidatus Korarchaeota archaeon]
MGLYEFAVYDMFVPTVAIFAFGMVYRLSRYVFLYKKAAQPMWRKTSVPHKIYLLIDAFVHAIVAAIKRSKVTFVSGIFLLHFFGVIPILFLLSHHIVWWSYYFPPYSILSPLAIPTSATSSALTLTAPFAPVTGMSHGFVNTIWGPLTVVLNGDVLAILAIIGTTFKLLEKIPEKFKEKLARVRLGDFVALLLLLAILISGYMATHHLPSGDIETYKFMLGLHILTAEILVLLLPFTKFFHFVFSFWYGKLHEAYDLWRRGL